MRVEDNVIYNQYLVPLIFSHLGAKDLVACGRVCKFWNEIVYKLEQTWQTFCEEYSIGPKISDCTWKDTFDRLFTIVKGDIVSEYTLLGRYFDCKPAFHGNLVAYHNNNQNCIQVDNLVEGQEVKCYSLNSVNVRPKRIEIDDYNLFIFDAPVLDARNIHVWDRSGSKPSITKELKGGPFFSNSHLITHFWRVGGGVWGNCYQILDLNQMSLEVQYEGVASILPKEYIYKLFFYKHKDKDCLVAVTSYHYFQILNLNDNNYLHSESTETPAGCLESTLQGFYLTSLYKLEKERVVRCWNLDQRELYTSFKLSLNNPTLEYVTTEFAMHHSVESDLFFYHITEHVLVYRMRTGEKIREIKSSIYNPVNSAITFCNGTIFLQKSSSEREVHRFVHRDKSQVTSPKKVAKSQSIGPEKNECAVQ